ncbi:major facilitator family transporter [Obelidium mucronatum]|nr:major facilitator family transporter [Obelidium mucronatum]
MLSLTSIVAATCAGTLIEWYDFYVYLFLQSTIAAQFYNGTESATTIIWLATYAIGFIVRPIGALLFGYLGDIYGRKSIFMATLWIMGIATALCGCLPTKDMIGSSAGIILIILRICQGLALGGEYGAAVAYIAEHAPADKKGLYTCALQVMATLGLSLSLASCLIFRSVLSAADWSKFGWRFPFLFSLILIGVSLYARSKLLESPIFAQAKEAGEIAPARFSKAALKPSNFLTILTAIVGTCMGQGVLAQVSQAYPLTFIMGFGTPLISAYTILLVPCLLACPFFALFGYLSDKYGRKWFLVAGVTLSAILTYPCYMGMYYFRPFEDNKASSSYRDGYSPAGMSFCIWILVMCAAISYGPLAAFLSELFPTNIRFTGTAACYHIGVGAIGGITGVVAVSIVTATGNMYGGLFYPISVSAVSGLVGMLFLPETNGRDLTTVGNAEKGDSFETSG